MASQQLVQQEEKDAQAMLSASSVANVLGHIPQSANSLPPPHHLGSNPLGQRLRPKMTQAQSQMLGSQTTP